MYGTGEVRHKSDLLDAKNCHFIQGTTDASRQLRCAKLPYKSGSAAEATNEEILHMVLLLSNTIGFPTMIIAYGWTKDMLERIEKEKI